MASKFEELIGRLDTVAKADCGDGDGGKKVAAAAADGNDKDKDKDKDKEGKGGEIAKSFEVTLADGTKAQAFDGTDALKALHAEHDILRGEVLKDNEQVLKAFDIVVGAIDQHRQTIVSQQAKLAEQDTIIKAMNAKLEQFGAAGVGRRTVLTVAEKLTPGLTVGAGAASGGGAQVTAGQVLMKAQSWATQGKMTFADAARVEAYQLRGLVAPQDIADRYPELLRA